MPFAVLLAGIGASCESPPASNVRPADADASASAEPGTLVGRVRLAEGVAVPAPRVITNTTDPAICGESHTLAGTRLDAESRGLADVIVRLPAGDGLELGTASAATLVLDNHDCRFEPHVAVATVGTVLETVNSDPVLHTTHLYGPREVNVSLPVAGARQRRELTEPGLFVVKCDIHGWMEAYLRVDRHPFHDVTDEAGSFRIDGVPAGNHRLELWHEQLGTLESDVSVEPGSVTTLELTFTEENTR